MGLGMHLLSDLEEKNSEISDDEEEGEDDDGEINNYQTFMECPNFYQKMVHME
jgi:hypothetical protein